MTLGTALGHAARRQAGHGLRLAELAILRPRVSLLLRSPRNGCAGASINARRVEARAVQGGGDEPYLVCVAPGDNILPLWRFVLVQAHPETLRQRTRTNMASEMYPTVHRGSRHSRLPLCTAKLGARKAFPDVPLRARTRAGRELSETGARW